MIRQASRKFEPDGYWFVQMVENKKSAQFIERFFLLAT